MENNREKETDEKQIKIGPWIFKETDFVKIEYPMCCQA